MKNRNTDAPQGPRPGERQQEQQGERRQDRQVGTTNQPGDADESGSAGSTRRDDTGGPGGNRR